eukprot:CAMPEP_0202062528 /NCGR_PEP_ID=MMETSP0963-20130614/44086_1 /ASSEMBLY_ACC=CAM_ASM_000494 /TAXON_ID=4773 /ORGANISM="Schizochytrium aggregatum, Strain ATCC28209" /LENGTH=126 /DNA_ID=CAMNT_0048628831 /DNA_START=94 /DNA_END=471 /DNA_ORIENTATION=+
MTRQWRRGLALRGGPQRASQLTHLAAGALAALIPRVRKCALFRSAAVRSWKQRVRAPPRIEQRTFATDGSCHCAMPSSLALCPGRQFESRANMVDSNNAPFVLSSICSSSGPSDSDELHLDAAPVA